VRTDASQIRRTFLKELRAEVSQRGAPRTAPGAPAVLTRFHVMLAAHFLWYRGQHPKLALKAAYSDVSKIWGVTRPAIEKYLKHHREEATQIAAVMDQVNFAQSADAFRIIGDPTALASARGFRKQIR